MDTQRFSRIANGLKSASISSVTQTADALRREGKEVLVFSIGRPDFDTPEHIKAAANDALAKGFVHYTHNRGILPMREAVAAYLKRQNGLDYDPKTEIMITAGAQEALMLCTHALLDPGDEVLVFGPYIADYNNQIYLAGGKMVEVVTKEENHYAPEEAAIRAAITPRTRAMIVNTPCNPTGAAYSMETLTMLAKLATEYDLLILADEIYTRYLYDGAFVPMRTLPGMADRVVTLNSFSKNFLMTGWRVGVVIAPAELISVFQFISNALTYTAPSISQRAAIRALALRHQIAEKYICKYRDRVFYASECIDKLPYMTLLRPRGTFYLFPGIAKTGMTDGQFCQFLLEKAHILAVPGSVFGKAGQGHFRIACTVSDEKLQEAMERLKDLSACF